MFFQQITPIVSFIYHGQWSAFKHARALNHPSSSLFHFPFHLSGLSIDTAIPSGCQSNPSKKHQKVKEIKKLGSSGSTYSRTVSLPLPPPKVRRPRPRNRSSLRRMGRSSVVCPLKTNQNKERSLHQVSYLRILKVLFLHQNGVFVVL